MSISKENVALKDYLVDLFYVSILDQDVLNEDPELDQQIEIIENYINDPSASTIDQIGCLTNFISEWFPDDLDPQAQKEYSSLLYVTEKV